MLQLRHLLEQRMIEMSNETQIRISGDGYCVLARPVARPQATFLVLCGKGREGAQYRSATYYVDNPLHMDGVAPSLWRSLVATLITFRHWKNLTGGPDCSPVRSSVLDWTVGLGPKPKTGPKSDRGISQVVCL